MIVNAENIFLKRKDLVKEWRIEKYAYVMDTVQKTNVASDANFQKTFNGFYRVRRGAEWRKVYYDFFERHKEEKNISFEEIVTYIFEKTGRIEASFSSKMLATFDSRFPIWDVYVMRNLGLELKGKTKEERLQKAIYIYDEMKRWYETYLNTQEAKDQIALFDRYLPEYVWLSDVKKIDFLLWSTR